MPAGQIALDDFEFGLILVDEILAIALAREHQRFFAARLLALEDLYDRSFVGLAADVFFDFEAGNFGEHAAQHHGAGLVAGFHRGRKFIAQFLLHNYLASSPQLTRVRRMAKGILSAQSRELRVGTRPRVRCKGQSSLASFAARGAIRCRGTIGTAPRCASAPGCRGREMPALRR